ncbi:MAG: amino acid permease [Acidobacteria bacterium]|nr:amino acid permease [Acidobacteriota bacterium]
MTQLVRGLGPLAAASVNIANMIGTGVFLKARIMTCNVGSPIEVLGVWIFAGLLVTAGALSYAELAAMMPKAGGEYVFLGATYGRMVSFLYGWTSILVSRTAAHAAQSVSTAIFLNIATGGALEGNLALTSIAVISLMTLVNCARVSTTGIAMSAITVIKIALVAAVGAAGFLFVQGNWAHYSTTNQGGLCAGVSASSMGGFSGFAAAMLGALWGYQGWANFAPMIGEIRDPGRNIPRAFLGAIIAVATVYLFANASYFFALTPTEVASTPLSSSVATEALSRFFGSTAVRIVAAGMTISSIGAIYAGMAATSRVPYAMAGDGQFFRFFDNLSSSTSVPVRSVVLIGAWMSVLALSGNYDRLTDYAVFALCIFYALNASAVLILRRRMPDAERPYRVWGYPFLPALFVLFMAAIILNTLITSTRNSIIGLAFMALGLPFYFYWSRRTVSSRE